MLLNYIKKLFFILITQGFLFSITINLSGKILDNETRKPIYNVNVFIEKKDIGTTTDQDGYFLLPIDDSNNQKIILNIKMIGYEKKMISVDLLKDRIDLGSIFIDKQAIELEPINIQSNNNSSNQISDITIAGSELNENLKGNIAMTLINYPNIGINSFGSVLSKPSVRGFSGDRFLLTNDGSESGDLSQSSIDHVITLDISEVNKVELIRGPKSLVYGLNAIGGVVNTSLVGSPNIRVDKFQRKFSIGLDRFNRGIHGDMMFYVPIANNQMNIFLSNRQTDNEKSSLGILDNTQSNTFNYKLGFTHYLKDAYLNLILQNFNMDYGIPPNPGGHITGVDILLNKKSAQINYHQDIAFGTFRDFNIKYNFIDYIHLELVNGEANSSDIFDIYNQGNYHVGLAKETHNLKFELNSKNSILGLELNKKDFIPSGYYLTPETNENYLSIYGFKNVKKSDLNFLTSFRLGYLESIPKNTDIQYINIESSDIKKRNFKTASFSFGVRKKIYKNNETIELNSWFMHTMRPPRVEELYSDGPHLGSYAYEIGNPDLKVEKIFGVENSLKYNNDPLQISFVTFYNYSPYYYEMAKMGDCPEALGWDPLSGTSHPCAGSDFIDWGSGAFGFLYKYNSRGSEAVIKGLEIDFKYNLEKFLLNYSFSYVHGNNKTIDRPLSYMSPTKQILTFEYNDIFINYKIRFSQIHAQKRLGEFEQYTSGAFLTDFVVTFNGQMGNVTIQLNNIFNVEYYNHLSRIKSITPEAGRNLSVNYKILF